MYGIYPRNYTRWNSAISKVIRRKDIDSSIGIHPSRVPGGILLIRKALTLNSTSRFPYLR